MNLNCLIVDDEPVAREGLKEYVNKIPFLQLAGVCKSALEAGQILSKHTIDLVFLDIQMPDMTGLELVQSLSQKPLIIFTTAYREFATDGFELDAIDYLVKPISFQRFYKAANKALSISSNQEVKEDYFFIKADGKYVKIKFDSILYLESAKDYLFIYTEQKRYMTLLSLKKVEHSLPEDHFLRVHRSYIVAKEKVDMIDGNQLIIQGKKIPVSRNMQEEIFSKLLSGKLWKRGH